MNYSVRTTVFILLAMLFCGARAANNVNQQNNTIVPGNLQTPPLDTNKQNLQTVVPESLWLKTMTTESKVLDVAVLALLAKKTGNVFFQKKPSFTDKLWIAFLTAAVFLRKDSMLTTGTSLCDGSQGFATWWCKSLNADPTRTLAITVLAVTGGCIMGKYLLDCVDSFWGGAGALLQRIKERSRLGFSFCFGF